MPSVARLDRTSFGATLLDIGGPVNAIVGMDERTLRFGRKDSTPHDDRRCVGTNTDDDEVESFLRSRDIELVSGTIVVVDVVDDSPAAVAAGAGGSAFVSGDERGRNGQALHDGFADVEFGDLADASGWTGA